MNVLAQSPAHPPARAARAEIEGVASALRSSGASFDRRGVAERLSRAIRALYAVIDTSVEAPAHHDGLVECVRVLGEVRAVLAATAPDSALAKALATLDATIVNVSRVSEEVLDIMLARRGDLRGGTGANEPRPTRRFLASVALPRLHAMARGPVSPPISLEPTVSRVAPRAKKPAPPKPTTLEELRAAAAALPETETETETETEAAAEPLHAPRALADDGELLRRVAHDCLEDIASLRMLRKPIPTETWLDQSPFEQRLLDNIDAFVALGEAALPSVTLFHAEAPAPDPARGFALALTLGCIEGTDTIDVALATMKVSAPLELPGFAEGFALAPNPAIATELEPLLDAPNPALCAVALDVLAARGALPLDTVERVLRRGDPALTSKLARALGLAVPKAKAISALSDMLDAGASDELFAVACESLLRRGDGAVRQRLRDAIRARASKPRVAAATALLAISGRRDDGALLAEGLAFAPSEASVRALGRHGSAALLPTLLALLETEDAPIALAAADALDFVTNAGLRETTQVPWTPGVTPPDGSPPPTRAVSTVILARVPWEQWYARNRVRLDAIGKLRAGQPFAPSMIVDELDGTAAPARRIEAALELVVATGIGARLSTTDWVARQKQHLGEVREHVRTLGGAAGSYWYAGAAVSDGR